MSTETNPPGTSSASEYVWKTPAATATHGYVWPSLKKRIEQLKPQSLLDIGCGNGALTHKYAEVVPRTAGTDFSTSAIDIAKEHFPGSEFMVSSVTEPLPDSLRNQFDVAVAAEVIEHLLLPRQLFERAREGLKPGGYFLVTTPYHGYLKNLALAVAGKWDHHHHPLRDYGHVKYFSRETLVKLFEEQGFSVDYFDRVGRMPALAKSMVMGGKLR